MTIEASILTPQQRLAVSRRALFNQIDFVAEGDAVESQHETKNNESPRSRPAPASRKRGMMDGIPWVQVGRSFAERWWRRHPANAMTRLAHPVLQRYARKQPVKLIGIAAGVGAALYLVKPWRLLSLTAILAGVLKTSDIADMVTTLMAQNGNNSRD
jgi:hypothetical protein